MVTDRFDIAARLPDGATKDDVPEMLRALLKERFKLTTHSEMQEQPVLGLVVGKGGPKLKEATEKPVAIDESEPLKAGETKMDTPDGPIRLMKNEDGSTTYKMGVRGTFTLKFDGESHDAHGSQLDHHEGIRHDDEHAGRRTGTPDSGHDGADGQLSGGGGFFADGPDVEPADQGIDFRARPGSGRVVVRQPIRRVARLFPRRWRNLA